MKNELKDTLYDATNASRKALATYWVSPLTSGITAVRCSCYDGSGKRLVAEMRHDGWHDGERLIGDEEAKMLKTLLARGPRGDVIVLGSVGAAWVSDDKNMW